MLIEISVSGVSSRNDGKPDKFPSMRSLPFDSPGPRGHGNGWLEFRVIITKD
jgi:hypothetical protein